MKLFFSKNHEKITFLLFRFVFGDHGNLHFMNAIQEPPSLPVFVAQSKRWSANIIKMYRYPEITKKC